MRCRSCEFENPGEMRFCIHCGIALRPLCPECGFENPREASFCGLCAAPIPGDSTPTDKSPPPDAERRHLTVMFCDLVGFTALSERLDPEDLRHLIGEFQEACGAIVVRFEGHVAQYLGDGILVYFGYPRAHEDDAARAVDAGLAILDALPALNARASEALPEIGDRPLQVRIGVSTGPVVIGEMGQEAHRERLALGDTVNVAARLLEVCDPDRIVISESTRHLAEGRFIVEALGERSLKGVTAPVSIFRVDRASGVTHRLEAASASGLTPLVGREREVSLMLDLWEQVQEGHGQALLLGGEPGMGKSRLLQVLRERLVSEPHAWIEGRCSPYHESSAFHPIVQLIEQGAGIGPEDTPEARIGRLEESLGRAGFDLEETVPLFATLLSIPLPARYPAPALSPEAQRRRTLESVASWLLDRGGAQPAVLVVEDLHWIDASSLEVLGAVLDEAPTSRILLLLTFRPTFEPPWATRSHMARFTLHPLTQKQIGEMIARIAGGKALPGLVVDQILEKTDGVPLFVEELTKMLLESGFLVESDRVYERADPLPSFAIPATLQDSLMARLDRLGPTREIAQLASVLGREFPHELLEAVSPLDPATLERGLARLCAAELIYRRGHPPRAAYMFKHALIQEAAYQSLLKNRRQQHHARIAEVIEERFPERARAQPEVVARHYEEAGDRRRAIGAYGRAAELATQRLANPEAIRHLTKAVDLLRALPESPERDEQELPLQVALGARLLEKQGYGGGDVERAYARARALCQSAGKDAPLFQALWGLSVFHQARNEHDEALEMGAQLMALADKSGDDGLRIMAHMAVGSPRHWKAEWRACLDHAERAIALYDPARHRSLAPVYGEDPGVSSRIYASQALWHLGFPDRAAARILEAVEVARQGAHPFSLGYALSFAAGVYYLRRERERARAWAGEAIALSEEQDLGLWLGMGRAMRGWSLTGPGTDNSGIAELEQGVFDLAKTGTEVGASAMIAMLAEGYAELERWDEALGTLKYALALAERRRSPFWNVEILRLRGDFLLRRDPAAAGKAEALFREAIDLARVLDDRGLGLRAAASLARMAGSPERRREALATLEGAFGAFTEGFDTPDLREARAILEGAR